MIEVYTDGSYRPSESMGGWGIVVIENGVLTNLFRGWEENTTNNRMELKAILDAKKLYGIDINDDRDDEVVIYSDSAYSVRTLTGWAESWQKNGWVKSDGETPKNLDLIQEYFAIPTWVELRHVKGHAGNKWNEMADKLATGTSITKFADQLPKDTAYYTREGVNYEFTF